VQLAHTLETTSQRSV